MSKAPLSECQVRRREVSLFNSIVSGFSPELISRVATQLGAPQGAVQKGVGAAAPAIVSAILGATRSDSGMVAFSDALSQSSSQTDAEFASSLDARFRSVAETGGEALASVIGGGQMGVLASKLRDFAGLPEGSAGAMLGVVSSALMRNLGNVAAERGLDGRALVSALNSEKSAIAQALPADFAKTLQGAGLIEAISDQLRPVAPQPVEHEPRPAQVRPAEHRAAASVRSEPVQPQGRPWWHWVAGLAALGLLIWFGSSLLRGTPKEAVVVEPIKDMVTAAPAAIPDASAAAKTATALVERLGTALDGITDEASARAAVPALGTIRDDLAGLQTVSGALPADGRTAVQGVLTAALPTLKTATDRLLGNTGIAAIIKPVLDEITNLVSNFRN